MEGNTVQLRPLIAPPIYQLRFSWTSLILAAEVRMGRHGVSIGLTRE